MGYLNALAIAASPLTLEEKLTWHRLDFDLFIPDTMVDLWVQAVRLHDFGMPENLEIDLPVGTTYKGTNKTTIGNLITEYCLEYFTLAFADDVPASPLDVPLECEKRRARV